ncbi:MAG: type II toxin-antitoxin system HicA family toxin [Syntrophobacteraceae bacterium]|jgi:predicted RNA binding protein YcfA (HicA-like mRNA interferase family)
MKNLSGRELARVLERNGWRLLRTQGSHHIYGKEGSIVRLSVPIHSNQPLKTGLLNHAETIVIEGKSYRMKAEIES